MTDVLPPPPPPVYAYSPRRPIAWVTWSILASVIAVFLCQLREVHVTGVDIVGDTLAFSPQAWDNGRYWTLVTYAWAHATSMFGDPGYFWLHIAANMIVLYCLGPALEEYLGHWAYAGLYFGGVVAAALFWFLFNADGDPGQGIIGASGAIFALIAGAGTAAPRMPLVVYFFFVLPIRMRMGTLALLACGLEFAQLIFGIFPEIAHTAHLGGALFGFLYVLVLRIAFGLHRVRV